MNIKTPAAQAAAEPGGRLSAVSSTLATGPAVFAGLPLSSWAFAIRIWLAVVVALYAAFWLELEAPSSAAVTVAILALPTRGQVLGKAVFRLLATVLGVAASFAITGLFTQCDGLLLGAFAVWLGICVYAGGLLDGNRAYAAALSGYTVAIVAVQAIDNPQHVFANGMQRGAAITVGVLAVTLVNDLLAAPDDHPHVLAQLETLRRRVVSYAQRAIRGIAAPAPMAAGLLRDIVALRPQIASLAAELNNGPVRSAAARNAMAGLVAAMFAARALEKLAVAAPPLLRGQLLATLEEGSGRTAASSSGALPDEHGKDSQDPMAPALAWFMEYLLRMDGEVRRSLSALSSATRLPRTWRAPKYRSHMIAAEAGIRAAICFSLAAAFYAISGWPATEVSLSVVALIIGLGAITPDPRAFTWATVLAAPIASLMAGILEFLVLDGVNDFPLLAIGLAPFMIGAALLMSVQNRMLSLIGRLNLIFILDILAPSNPQTYNPQAFLFSVLFLLLATGLLFAAQILVPSASDSRRRGWLLAAARDELKRLPSRQNQDFAAEEAMFRDAGRVAMILTAEGDAPQYPAAMAEAMANFDQAAILRLRSAKLKRLTEGSLRTQANAAYSALIQRDPRSVLASAQALHGAASSPDASVEAASAALAAASAAFTSKNPDAVERKP